MGDFANPEVSLEEHIGLRIKDIREVLHITREDFAEKTNLSTSYISLIEAGKRQIKLETLQVICFALNVPSSKILPF